MSDSTMVRNGGEAPQAAKGGAGAEAPAATADAMMNQDAGQAPDPGGTASNSSADEQAHTGGAVHAH